MAEIRDKEAQEKMATKVESQYPGETLQQWRLRIAGKVLTVLGELGYRKSPKEYRGCPHCGSIWVCWNWIQADYEKSWCHECWDCSNCSVTPSKVEDGMPYDFLRAQYRTLLPKDKPPLLSDEKTLAVKNRVLNKKYPRMTTEAIQRLQHLFDEDRAIAQAQREADIKFYTDIKDDTKG